MAYSSILGAEKAPALPSGRDAGALGPSDNSDSGSDAIGTHEAHADSDSVGTGERGSVTPDVGGREGGDILPDHVIVASSEEEEAGGDASMGELADLDEESPGEDAEAR